MALTFITIIYWLSVIMGDTGVKNEKEELLLIMIIFIFGFFPGLFYYRFNTTNIKVEKIVRVAFILQIISVITMIVAIILMTFASNNDLLAFMGAMFMIASVTLYFVGVLWLIFYKLVMFYKYQWLTVEL